MPDEPFTQEKLNKVWFDFNESIKSEMPRLHLVFKDYKPMQKTKHSLILQVGSTLQKKDIEDRAYSKMDGFLKKRLNNYKIKLEVMVIETQQKRNFVYTSSDKYKYLADKNNNLDKLKQNFSLDLE